MFDPYALKEYAVSYRYDGKTGSLFITDAYTEYDALMQFFSKVGAAATFHITDVNIGLYEDGRIITQALKDVMECPEVTKDEN